MNDWSDGCVTEISYSAGFYRDLVPSFLGFVGLLAGIEVPLEKARPVRYLELGCGQGVTACIVAAANPAMDVVAIDFHPAHIAEAQSLAEHAGISNVQFLEMSFEEAKDNASLGSFDFITLHGIYSWVGQEVRRQVVDLLLNKLCTGGIVYISYNSYPGRATSLPLQRLLYEVASAEPGAPITDRLKRGMDLLQRLESVGAGYFKMNPSVSFLLKELKKKQADYLAHEYLSATWTPFFFPDVAAELSTAKLEYVGSTDLLLYLDGINFTPEQQRLLTEVTDKAQRQVIRDFLTNRSFRRDIFARGARRLSPSEIEQRWLQSRFALTRPRENIQLKVRSALGEIPLDAKAYEPVIAKLRERPQTFRELLSDSAIASSGTPRLKQVLTVLVAQNVCQPALSADADNERRKSTDRFNETLLNRAITNASLAYMASPVTGGGVAVDQVRQLALAALREKVSDVPEFIRKAISGQARQLIKNGNPVGSREEGLEMIRERMRSLDSMRDVLAKIGIC
jgi:SAM-dependent methyltransferase